MMVVSVVARQSDVFTEEALRAQDGKKVPLRLDGGPIIGEVELKYDPHEKALKAEFRVDDVEVVEFLKTPTVHIYKKES